MRARLPPRQGAWPGRATLCPSRIDSERTFANMLNDNTLFSCCMFDTNWPAAGHRPSDLPSQR
eukprot:3167698-Alexandrium_andersonii.AAC.1